MQQKNGNLSRVSVSFFGERARKVRSRSRPYTAPRGRKAHVRSTLYRRKLGGRPLVAPTFCTPKFSAQPFPASYNFIARSATCNCGKGKHAVFD